MSAKSTAKNFAIKIVLIGDSGVGKTTLINRYVSDKFDHYEPPTISGGFRKKVLELPDHNAKVTLQIWDTAGQEKFRAIVGNYYTDARCAVVMYDITSQDSFESTKAWIKEVKNKAPENVMIYLWGSKLDLEDKRGVTLQSGHKLSKEEGAYFGETSSKLNIGVAEVFEKIATEYVEKFAEEESKEAKKTVSLKKPKAGKEGKKGCKW